MKSSILLLLGILFLIACKTQYQAKPKYDFPPAMAVNIRENFTKLCDQGAILYDKNCARCHNSKVKGKMVIPDFTEEKLAGYAIRVANKKHESSMPDSLVSVEDLSLISTFLMYKPKNNLASK